MQTEDSLSKYLNRYRHLNAFIPKQILQKRSITRLLESELRQI